MRVLVVAFDGLDSELIEEYDCQNLQQEEFGSINNDIGDQTIDTIPLFASFITGKTDTGIDFWVFENKKLERLENFLNKFFVFRKFQGLRRAIYQSIKRVPGNYQRLPTKEDIEIPTLFDKIPNSKALNVPSYNKNMWIDLFVYMTKKGASIPLRHRQLETEFRQRKRELWSELEEEDPKQFLMTHFQYPDNMHHLFYEINDMETVKSMYKEMDDLAGDIKKRASEKYDCIIFMSDHGLPAESANNENAFYSCNMPLFTSTPHITDFYDKILELVDPEDEALDGIDL